MACGTAGFYESFCVSCSTDLISNIEVNESGSTLVGIFHPSGRRWLHREKVFLAQIASGEQKGQIKSLWTRRLRMPLETDDTVFNGHHNGHAPCNPDLFNTITVAIERHCVKFSINAS
jgi:hypothetical protein